MTRHPTETDTGDVVECLNCHYRGEVERGADICPKCAHPAGTLADPEVPDSSTDPRD